MQTFTAHTADELKNVAPKIIEAFGDRRIIAFDAPMGAGKTTLIKALCEEMGSNSIVNSPTFAIVNDYELPDGNSVYHFDLYRLKNIGEAIDMGCEDYFYSGCFCFVEWPDVADAILPADTVRLTISVADDGTRTISIE